MVNELLLLSGQDIPFPLARVDIHTPKIKEIGLIGEENFHLGIQFLNFSKDKMSLEDKSDLENKSDFDIFMAIVNDKKSKDFKNYVTMVLSLLFPNYQIKFSSTQIILRDTEKEIETGISEFNYDMFKKIISDMFCLNQNNDLADKKYNPADKMAEKIAEKFKKAEQKRNKNKCGSEKIAIFNRYISILSVGLKKDMNELMNYTVYQLFDEYQRFKLKQDFDMYIKIKLAGASDVEEVEDWMKDIHV